MECSLGSNRLRLQAARWRLSPGKEIYRKPQVPEGMQAWGWERGLEEREEAALESRQLGLPEGRAGRKLAAGVWLPQEGSSQAAQREQSRALF